MKEAAASARTADMFERKGLRRESGAVSMRVMPSVRTPVARKWTKLMLLTEARNKERVLTIIQGHLDAAAARTWTRFGPARTATKAS